jgi:two-component system, NtrC family, response regulator HydG
MKKLLIIDDVYGESADCDEITSMGLSGTYKVFVSTSLSENDVYAPSVALRDAMDVEPDIILLDLIFGIEELPTPTGISILEKLREWNPVVPIVMFSESDPWNNPTSNDPGYLRKSIEIGANGFISKQQGLEVAGQILREDIDDMKAYFLYGNSLEIREVRRKVALASFVYKGNVLLSGETGTGKNNAARMIHRLSVRRGEKFCSHVCTEESLIESLLFGRKKGAFTGAHQDEPGWIETAGSGTLFLDELQVVRTSTQTKLNQVIQDNDYNRVGATTVKKSECRFIFAVNEDPVKLIEQGRLNRDFHSRIAESCIEIPPLRDRPSDIPIIAKHLVGRLKEREDLRGLRGEYIDDSELEQLSRLELRGNVRELNAILGGAFIESSTEIQPKEYDGRISISVGGGNSDSSSDGLSSNDPSTCVEFVRDSAARDLVLLQLRFAVQARRAIEAERSRGWPVRWKNALFPKHSHQSTRAISAFLRRLTDEGLAFPHWQEDEEFIRLFKELTSGFDNDFVSYCCQNDQVMLEKLKDEAEP